MTAGVPSRSIRSRSFEWCSPNTSREKVFEFSTSARARGSLRRRWQPGSTSASSASNHQEPCGRKRSEKSPGAFRTSAERPNTYRSRTTHATVRGSRRCSTMFATARSARESSEECCQAGGRVLIRSGFGDRLDGVRWLRYFPSAQDIAADRWPTVESTTEVFATAGFEVEALHSVPEIVAPNLSAYYERIAVRASSTLTLIDDDEFEQGIERLRQEAAAASGTEPVVDERDLLVLR